jgi:iron complex outermembrane receptor protein
LALSSAPVAAQEAEPLEAQAGRVATFDIPAQPLSQALTTFGRQSGLQVAFDPAAAAGKSSVALGGSMTAEQALRTLLGASGLSYQFTSSGAVTVSGASGGSGAMQLDPVRVQSNVVPPQAMIDNLPPPYAGGQVATGGQVGLLGERTFMNTPFNQNSYTETLIENQQARSVADVLDNDPSVRTNYASAAGLDQATIRGFDASDISFNGLYGVAPSRSNVVAIEGIERVEVLRGPSAMLFGMAPRGNIGGNINVVPKRAGETPVTRFTGSYISSTQFGGHIDVGRRFGADNSFGARFNGVLRDGTTSVNGQSAYTGAAVLGLDFRRDNLRVSLDAGYQKQRTTSTRRPLAVLPNVPVPQAPPPQNNWSQPWSLADLQDVYGAFRAEIDPFENVTAYVTVGGNLRRAKYLSENLTLQNVNGLVTGSTNVSVSSQTSSTVEGGVRARGNTGPIAHDFALVGNLFWYQLGTIANNVALPASNYNFRGYAPVPFQGGLPLPQDAPRTQWQQLSSVGAADTLSILDERIQLTVGGRQQQVQSRNFAVSGAVTANYDQSVFSPMFALVVKPIENLSVYGNFIQGLQPGASAPIGTLNAGQIFAPYVSRQYEVGVKWNLGTFAATLNAFQISQPSAITNPVTNIFSVDGEQVNRGLEFMTFGEPLPGFRLLGGFTMIDARLTQTAGGLNQGNKAPGVPDFMLNATTEWDASFLRGLTFMGRVIYTSAQYINNANTQAVPAWTRLDLGARYRFELAGQGVTVRANMENVLNAGYWNVANGTSIGLSYPRTFLLSAAIDF